MQYPCTLKIGNRRLIAYDDRWAVAVKTALAGKKVTLEYPAYPVTIQVVENELIVVDNFTRKMWLGDDRTVEEVPVELSTWDYIGGRTNWDRQFVVNVKPDKYIVCIKCDMKHTMHIMTKHELLLALHSDIDFYYHDPYRSIYASMIAEIVYGLPMYGYGRVGFICIHRGWIRHHILQMLEKQKPPDSPETWVKDCIASEKHLKLLNIKDGHEIIKGYTDPADDDLPEFGLMMLENTKKTKVELAVNLGNILAWYTSLQKEITSLECQVDKNQIFFMDGDLTMCVYDLDPNDWFLFRRKEETSPPA